MKPSIFVRTTIASAILAATPAIQAQTVIDEIVVTARKRDETYVDVPVTVTVFTAS